MARGRYGSGSNSPKFTVDDLHPVHYEILKRLPREGELSGLYKLAKTTRQIKSEINPIVVKAGGEPLESSSFAGLMKQLQYLGLVTNTRLAAGNTLGWQITPQGQELLQTTYQEGEQYGNPEIH